MSGVELFEFYINNCDESELRNDNVILNEIKRLKAVNDPREMGDWIEVEIDAEKKRVTCNCEEYNFGAYSAEIAFFEVLQFGKPPPIHCKPPSERWQSIKIDVLRVLKRAIKERTLS